MFLILFCISFNRSTQTRLNEIDLNCMNKIAPKHNSCKRCHFCCKTHDFTIYLPKNILSSFHFHCFIASIQQKQSTSSTRPNTMLVKQQHLNAHIWNRLNSFIYYCTYRSEMCRMDCNCKNICMFKKSQRFIHSDTPECHDNLWSFCLLVSLLPCLIIFVFVFMCVFCLCVFCRGWFCRPRTFVMLVAHETLTNHAFQYNTTSSTI